MSRTGLPVRYVFERKFGSTKRVSANDVAIAEARARIRRLARPSTAFCSCTAAGILRSAAAANGGSVGYPPKPITADGLMRPSRRKAALVPHVRFIAARAAESGDQPACVAERMV